MPTPFHPRTAALSQSLRWKDWAGYYAACAYETCHEPEYFAIRHAAALIDVTPLYKYEIRGRDAARFLSRVLVRDAATLKAGQVTYTCWCDDAGKVLDDGTVTRFEKDHFRLTAAEPTYGWLARNARGFAALTIEDVTDAIATLSVQGPLSRAVVASACGGGDVEGLGFFRATRARVGNAEAVVSRTGYTGDLGYEIWIKNADALGVWDALTAAGRAYGLVPCGLDAMDVARVEAGFIMNGVDYLSANRCVIESRKSTPDEIGMAWAVQLEREPFIGQAAIRAERARGAEWAFAGVELDWDEYERLHARYGLPPAVSTAAWRGGVPIYVGEGGPQAGYATSGAWSPMAKRALALATLRAEHAAVGTELRYEVTVEYERHTVAARVAKMPAFNPARKRAK